MIRPLVEGFTIGSASILTNVCLLPLYPGMIAFLAGNQGKDANRSRAGWLGLAVLTGLFVMLLIIGIFFSLVTRAYTPLLPVFVIISYVLVIALGALMLAGRNPFARMATIQMPVMQNPVATAFIYGLLLAPMTLPCTGGLLLAALGRVVGLESLFSEGIFLVAFTLGFGWPLVALPLIAVGAQRQFIGWMTKNHTMIERVAGALLLVIGLYGFVVDVSLFTGV